jgi:Mor transcription activator family
MKTPTTEELADLLGSHRAANALLQAAGGQMLYVPTRLRAETKLARMIGLHATHRLMSQWAGQQLRLPGLVAKMRFQRDAKIRQAAVGTSPDQLARQYGLTVRQIYNILSR